MHSRSSVENSASLIGLQHETDQIIVFRLWEQIVPKLANSLLCHAVHIMALKDNMEERGV